jgi:hypothetical protein
VAAAEETTSFLSAYLLGHETDGAVDGPGLSDDLVPLVQRAFVIAARCVFGPAWTRTDVMQVELSLTVVAEMGGNSRPRPTGMRCSQTTSGSATGTGPAPGYGSAPR